MKFIKNLKNLFGSGSTQIVHGNGNIVSGGSIVNGKTLQVSSISDIELKNGILYIDGERLDHSIIINIIGPTKDIDIMFANEVNITGETEDIIAEQGDIVVTGTVKGYAKSSQGNMRITGNVGGDIFSSQGDVDIGGSVEGNVKSSMGDISIKNK
jgi:uncharacterized protein (DUF342 family)